MVDTMPAGLFVACAAGAALTTHTLGRVLGWGGVIAGVVAVIATAATGVHVENFVAVPFLLLFLWILLVSFRLGFQRTRNADAEADRSAELAV
jgi:Sec-independent protein secretion pathway component TatC